MSLLPQLHRHPWMDEGIEAFREQAKRYIAKELVPHLDDWRRQGFIPREVWQPFGELGFLLPEMPEAYGGAGMGNVELALRLGDALALARERLPPVL